MGNLVFRWFSSIFILLWSISQELKIGTWPYIISLSKKNRVNISQTIWHIAISQTLLSYSRFWIAARDANSGFNGHVTWSPFCSLAINTNTISTNTNTKWLVIKERESTAWFVNNIFIPKSTRQYHNWHFEMYSPPSINMKNTTFACVYFSNENILLTHVDAYLKIFKWKRLIHVIFFTYK